MPPAATPRTAVLTGLVGSGIQRSRSPALHEREGAALGLTYLYKTIDLDLIEDGAGALPRIIAAARLLGFNGLNITHPCKQSVIPLMDALSDDARILGAVNTVVFAKGRAVGHNTDWSGFAESFRRELPDARRERVALCGAGGAGAAVAYALLALGAGEIRIFDTDIQRAETLAALLRPHAAGRALLPMADLGKAMTRVDGVVNATPMGMAKYPGTAIPAGLLKPMMWVADIVYVPLATELLGLARRNGCRVMSGGGMAVFQAAGAFRLFSGRDPDVARMLRHFDEMSANETQAQSA